LGPGQLAKEGAKVFSTSIFQHLADGRVSANLLTFYGLIVVAILAGLVTRALLAHGRSRLTSLKGFRWLETIGQEAVRRLRLLTTWLTLAVSLVLVLGGIAYHKAGRDIRQDIDVWSQSLTTGDLLVAGEMMGIVIALILVSWLGVRAIRRIRPGLQTTAIRWVGGAENAEDIQRWFSFLQAVLVAEVRLLALDGICRALGLGMVSMMELFVVVVAVLAGARLLTLACKIISQPMVDYGERYLGRGHFRHYWERVVRLVPFGQHCFEAAIYVVAATRCAHELEIFTALAGFGPKIVHCIVILMGTRVLIEFLQVLLNEAFGFYRTDRRIDSHIRTLVPLLHSVCQYVLYFGSAIVMLGTLGIQTAPILAGAGIVGLAVGLGAQGLVTDVVSGFFILFENQYLVGDYVQIGDASGTVEAVGIRLTQIRDGYGKLHIIPNGQVKGVVNYSKGYVNAVVDLKVPAGTDLESVFRAMHEAGRRLRQSRKEVLEDTQVHGLIDLGSSDMTVRAVTKVLPGTHGSMQNEYRRLLKQVFDQNPSTPRLAQAA
jgi:small conductance mechanosensitive channel